MLFDLKVQTKRVVVFIGLIQAGGAGKVSSSAQQPELIHLLRVQLPSEGSTLADGTTSCPG